VVTLPPAPAAALPEARTETTPPEAPIPTNKPAVKPTDGRLVQIAAFADIEAARSYRQKLLSMPLLIKAQIDIVSVDLGRHGQFHRVVANPTESSAEALCNGLKTQGIDCLTISP
jgi:cell division septation protein DedD